MTIVLIVLFFLVVMAVMSIFARFRTSLGDRMKSPKKCTRCGRYLIGKGKCDCGRG